MTADKIIAYCLDRLEGIAIVNSWGERGVFYNPENRLKRGVYILTLKEKDGENDSASQLNRKGIYRVNIGVRKSTFEKMFGAVPARPPKGGTADMGYDNRPYFTASRLRLDELDLLFKSLGRNV